MNPEYAEPLIFQCLVEDDLREVGFELFPDLSMCL